MSIGCRVTAARRAKRRHFIIKISLKTILIGLCIFRCGNKRSESVHGTPSWELAPYNRESERTKDFPTW